MGEVTEQDRQDSRAALAIIDGDADVHKHGRRCVPAGRGRGGVGGSMRVTLTRPARVFHPYLMWEDYQHGMFRAVTDQCEADQLRGEAAGLLARPSALRLAMQLVTTRWPRATEMNLTNRNRNRQAWLGQAACCLWVGAPDGLTKEAWHTLLPGQQAAANAVADEVIAAWEAARMRSGDA